MKLLLAITLLVVPAFGQSWSGIIGPTRAVNWQRSTVGVPGGIPTNYTQCGATIAAYSGTAATINAAIAACGANQFVLLGAGTFSISTSIDMRGKSNLALRGSGPNLTSINCSNADVGGSFGACIYAGTTSQFNSDSASTQPGQSRSATWTAGFAKGATSITLTNVGSSGILNGDIIILDQKGDTSDTNGYLQCATTSPLVCMAQNAVEGRIIGGVPYSQEQFVKVTAGCTSACNGAGPYTLTISPGLYANSWNQGNGAGNTGAWFVNPVVNVGIENLKVDTTSCPDAINCNSGIVFFNVYGGWAKNVTVVNTRRNHIYLVNGYRDEVRDSYLYGTKNSASQSYGVELFPAFDSLIENTIAQQIATPIMSGGGAGNVLGYNFSINNMQGPPSFSQGNYFSHSAGNYMNLWEGNIANDIITDQLHGTGGLFTAFRNWFNGYDWNTCTYSGGVCINSNNLANHPDHQTQPVQLASYIRGVNIIGNVLGTPGYHSTYQYATPTNTGTQAACNATIYTIGYSNGPPVCSIGGPGGVADDTLVNTTLMRWGNYDVVNAAVRFDNTESAPGASTYIGAQSTPASHTLPASFYLSGTPAFWGSMPFPPIGPDVTGGNGGTYPSGTYARGICPVGKAAGGSTCSSSMGGFVNVTPAMNCYMNVLSGPQDGSGGVLGFDATACYTGQAPVPVPGSPFIANLSVNGVAPVAVLTPASINFGNQATGSSSAPQGFTLSNTGTSNLNFTITKVGTNPGDFSVTTQCNTPLAPSTNCPVSVVFSPTTTGARSATVRVTDDAAGSPHDGAVSGTGIATTPAVCLNVNTVAFGNQPVSTSSASKPVVVTNCGTANLVISAVNATGNFSSTGCVTTVLPNNTCTINGTFSPLSAGNLTGTFSIVSTAASSPDVITLSGFGTQTGATLTATAVFGHVVVGVTSTPIVLTLTNTGNVSLGLNTPTLSGSNPGDFTFGNSCGATLAPQAICQISTTFIPTIAGARSATLNQSFTGGVSTVTSALSGTGDAATPAVTLIPTTLDFGSVTTGVTSASKTVQVQNSGNAILNITSITLTGANAADYALTNHCGLTLAAGSVCTVDVTVTPGGVGARTANVHLIDDAANSPQDVTMTTNGVAAPAPKVVLSPTSLAFSPPSIQTGTTSGAMNITATNTGNADLVVSSVALGGSNPGDFTLTNNCTTVHSSMNCAATVNCKPTVAGARTASVIFTSNAASSPDTATLSCTGFVGTPNITIAVSSINFGNQTVGTTSGPAAFTLKNDGLAAATGVSITAAGDFAVTDNCGSSITVGTTCSASVTFSPLILCGQFDPNNPTVCLSNVHLGTVSVVSNTSNSPQVVNLQGTAIPAAPPPGPIIMGLGGNVTVGGRLTIN